MNRDKETVAPAIQAVDAVAGVATPPSATPTLLARRGDNAALIEEAMATAGSDYTTERAADSIVALINALTDSEAIKDKIKNILMDQIAELIRELRGARAENARLREALAYYFDQLCEKGPHSEVCGHMTPDECGGCFARQALTGGQ